MSSRPSQSAVGSHPSQSAAGSRFPEDVDVAIVAHNNLASLPGTLQALFDAGCPPDRITVVDVAGSDGTSEWLAREHRRVRVRRLDLNEGPNPARNIGITESSRRFVSTRRTSAPLPRARCSSIAPPRSTSGSSTSATSWARTTAISSTA